ncbi:MAG TPA: SpoIIE family protein phosphatase, partial [Solirubrobacterales bacterium]|nr:SpoIIE family protein phosphatase [Solirubrobacterales bacterium]
RELAWAVAGHPAPLSLPELEAFQAPGRTLLLGVDSELALSTLRVRLDPGGGVFTYTDGATDVRDDDGSTLGEAGLHALLEPLARMDANRLVAGAERAILDWSTTPIKDDLCLLAMRPVGASRREPMF